MNQAPLKPFIATITKARSTTTENRSLVMLLISLSMRPILVCAVELFITARVSGPVYMMMPMALLVARTVLLHIVLSTLKLASFSLASNAESVRENVPSKLWMR